MLRGRCGGRLGRWLLGSRKGLIGSCPFPLRLHCSHRLHAVQVKLNRRRHSRTGFRLQSRPLCLMVRKRYADPCHVNLFLFHVPILKMPRIPPGLCSFALRSQFNLSALQSLFHSVYVSLISVDDIFMSKAFCVRHFSINVSLSFGHSLNNSAAIFFGQSYCHHVFPRLAFACLMGEVLLSIDPLSIPMSYFPERFFQIANIPRFSCGLRQELPMTMA